jgi:hypothetical protein
MTQQSGATIVMLQLVVSITLGAIWRFARAVEANLLVAPVLFQMIKLKIPEKLKVFLTRIIDTGVLWVFV